MTANTLRALGLVAALLTAWGASACRKSAAACDSTAQCESGFVCSAAGLCEEVSIDEADAAPACPQTHMCAGAVPTGWTGPVTGTRAGIGETLASCSGEYETEVVVVGEAVIAQGSCSCSCSDDAIGVDCGSASVVERVDAGSNCLLCPVIGTTCDSHLIPSNGVCELIPADVGDLAAVRVSLGGVIDSGECAAAMINNDLAAFFASDERYCAAEEIAATCSGGGPCMPLVDNDAFTAMCIFQSGEHECPADYPEKELRFEDIDDARSCTACSCVGPAIGTSCGGAVHLGVNTSQGCQSDVEVNATSCITNPVSTGGGTAGRYVPDPDTACTLEGGVQSGEAAATGQTTFCCTEAIPDPVLN